MVNICILFVGGGVLLWCGLVSRIAKRNPLRGAFTPHFLSPPWPSYPIPLLPTWPSYHVASFSHYGLTTTIPMASPLLPLPKEKTDGN